MIVVICDKFNHEVKRISVPPMRTKDGRADLIQIRRHLRANGISEHKVRAA